MSIAKRLHEERTMAGGWRKVVKTPTRGMWEGGRSWAYCPSCPWGMDCYQDEKLPSQCPRCSAFLVREME